MVLLSILASWALTPGKISGCLALGQIYVVNLGGNAFFCWWDAIFSFPNGTRIPFILFPINMATSAKSSIFRPTRDIVYIIWRFIFFWDFFPCVSFFFGFCLEKERPARKEGRKEGRNRIQPAALHVRICINTLIWNRVAALLFLLGSNPISAYARVLSIL